jgi:uncharacterized protein
MFFYSVSNLEQESLSETLRFDRACEEKEVSTVLALGFSNRGSGSKTTQWHKIMKPLERQYKDLVAYRPVKGPPIAFHSRNLEVAEISEELWIAFSEEGAPLRSVLNAWNAEDSGSVKTQNLGAKVKTLTINVTQICNLHCHYCAAGGDGTYGDPVRQISIEKTFPQIRFFMEKLEIGETFSFVFLGGEPLLYPEALRGLAQYASDLSQKKNIKVSFHIITNGTLIDQKFVDLMEGLRPSLTLSMDGDPETNDRVRPQKNGLGSSSQGLAGLRILLANKEKFGSLTIHSVFNRKNLDPLQAYIFFRQFQVDSFEMTFDVTEKDEQANQIFIEQMKKVAQLAFSKGGESELRRIAMFNDVFRILDGQTKKMNHCGSGKSLLSLDARNQIFACPLEVSDKTTQVGSGTQVNQEKLERLQSALIDLNNCGRCWARHLCGGGCLYSHKATTGNAHTKHPTYCERTRSLIIEAISYYKQTRAEGESYGKK